MKKRKTGGTLEKFSWAVSLSVMALCLLAAAGAHAHSLFIQSTRYHVHTGKASPLFFCYGHHIPVDDGVRGAKLKSVRVHTPGGEIRDISIRNETCLQSYMVDYELPGTYVLTAETNPGYYTVYTDLKGRERHTIKPKSAIIDGARSVSKSLYSSQYAKTYVVCETPSATFPANVGLPLELVPAKDISTLRPGENLELFIYYHGKPYHGQGSWDATYNGFSTQAEDMFYPRSSVSGEKLSIPILLPGRWFVRYFVKTDAKGAEKEQFTHMKHTATLTFEIPNERKRSRNPEH